MRQFPLIRCNFSRSDIKRWCSWQHETTHTHNFLHILNFRCSTIETQTLIKKSFNKASGYNIFQPRQIFTPSHPTQQRKCLRRIWYYGEGKGREGGTPQGKSSSVRNALSTKTNKQATTLKACQRPAHLTPISTTPSLSLSPIAVNINNSEKERGG